MRTTGFGQLDLVPYSLFFHVPSVEEKEGILAIHFFVLYLPPLSPLLSGHQILMVYRILAEPIALLSLTLYHSLTHHQDPLFLLPHHSPMFTFSALRSSLVLSPVCAFLCPSLESGPAMP